MGGLALGSGLAGKAAARLRNPARVYALLETGVAIFALATPSLFEAVDRGYVAAYPHVSGSSKGLLAVRFGLAAAALLAPTILMGASLPVLARAAERGDAPGRPSTALFAVNTAGAVAGVALAGLVFIPAFGFWATLVASACTSLAAALLALVLPTQETAPEAAAPGLDVPPSDALDRRGVPGGSRGDGGRSPLDPDPRPVHRVVGLRVLAHARRVPGRPRGRKRRGRRASPRDAKNALSMTQTALAFVLLAQVAAFALYTRILVGTALGSSTWRAGPASSPRRRSRRLSSSCRRRS